MPLLYRALSVMKTNILSSQHYVKVTLLLYAKIHKGQGMAAGKAILVIMGQMYLLLGFHSSPKYS